MQSIRYSLVSQVKFSFMYAHKLMLFIAISVQAPAAQWSFFPCLLTACLILSSVTNERNCHITVPVHNSIIRCPEEMLQLVNPWRDQFQLTVKLFYSSAGRSRWWIEALQCCWCGPWFQEWDSIFTMPGWETPQFFMFWRCCWPKQGSSAGPQSAFGSSCWSNTVHTKARCLYCSSFLGKTGCRAAADVFSWKSHSWMYWALASLLYFLWHCSKSISCCFCNTLEYLALVSCFHVFPKWCLMEIQLYLL